ncbi:hypothetical protein D3C76_1497310 [compost metagenome]
MVRLSGAIKAPRIPESIGGRRGFGVSGAGPPVVRKAMRWVRRRNRRSSSLLSLARTSKATSIIDACCGVKIPA